MLPVPMYMQEHAKSLWKIEKEPPKKTHLSKMKDKISEAYSIGVFPNFEKKKPVISFYDKNQVRK